MKKILVCIIFILQFILVACSQSEAQAIEFDSYDGRNLTIGVIGKAPDIREKDFVEFKEIQFPDLKDTATEYDAIIITEENLSEAADDKYITIYEETKVPYFFIRSNKSYMPFVYEGSYEEAPDYMELAYAIGILYKDGELSSWAYGLYNDIESEDNIQYAFTNIFKTIDEYSGKWFIMWSCRTKQWYATPI